MTAEYCNQPDDQQCIRELASHESARRLRAVQTLGQIHAKHAIPDLTRLLAHEKEQSIRKKICWAIREIGLDNTEHQELVRLLCNSDPDVKLDALDCLLLHENYTPLVRDSVKPLIRLLMDEDRQVRVQAALLLINLRAGVIQATYESYGGDIGCAEEMLAKPGLRERIEALIVLADYGATECLEFCSDSRPGIRLAASVAASRIGCVAQPYLIPLLADENPENREVAAIAIGHIGDINAVPSLEEALLDKDPGVRHCILRALGELLKDWLSPSASSIGSSRTTNEDPWDSQVADRQQIEGTLYSIACSLRDPSIRVRIGACSALAAIGSPAVVVLPDLLNCVTDDDSLVQWMALAAIQAIGPRSPQAMLHLASLIHSCNPSNRYLVKATLLSLLQRLESNELTRELQVLLCASDENPSAIYQGIRRILEERGTG